MITFKPGNGRVNLENADWQLCEATGVFID